MSLLAPVASVVPPPTGPARLLAAGSPAFRTHLETFGARPRPGRDRLLGMLEASGLTGRGGAGFAAWRKLAATGPAPVVIGNASEGEPLSSKDAALLEHAPHLVLDGLLVVADALGAAELHLVLPPERRAGVAAAVAERGDAGGVRLVDAAPGFVSGEASALVHRLEGGRPVPRDHPQRLAVAGLRGRPTLVHNAETLAHVALVARFGASWFRERGTADDPGTRLVTVCGDVAEPRVLEVPGGAPLAEVLRAAGADPAATRAVLVGGYHGAWVAGAGRFLSPGDAPPGAGVLLRLARGGCGVATSARIARYLAEQSARQCGPCANGLPRMAGVLERIARGDRDPGLADEVRRLAALVAGRGACHHPDGTVRLVLSTLEVFADDVAAHLEGRCAEAAR